MLTDEQIAEIKALYNNWQSTDTSLYADVPEFCKAVKLDGADGLRAQNYSLAPSKYIEFIDHDLEIDYEAEMARIQAEMQEVLRTEKASQAMLAEAFRGIGYGID